jgi:septal ring factor EnvC (AmiA/AmiB activator)
MKRIRSIVVIAMLGLLPIAFFGCGGVTEEQLAQLDQLKKEVASLQKEANTLKGDRENLEKQIAEKNKKLEECMKLKQEVRSNLDKIGK